jgi:LacI family repressor for deo operon, udp, cdd, tsx, nupC, and nupG
VSETPTIKEIAKRLNISVSTVSRALHDHPSIGLRTKMRVREIAKEINYEPNQTAIFFQQKKTFTIGVILPELSEAFFASAISGIEDAANNHKYTVLMGQSHDDTEREKRIVQTMKNHRVDGLIVSISKNTVDFEHFENLKKYGIPIVFFDRIPNIADVNYVACNMESGTILAVNYLLKNRHRVIGMINGPEKLFACQERKEGYIKAMTKNRLKYDPNLIVSTDLSREGTYNAMEQLLSAKRKPDAIVAFNDYVVLDAVKYALQKGLTIHKDITFVSYANLPFSRHAAFPPIASVEQFPYQQGQKATEILFELLNNKSSESPQTTYRKITLEPQLIIHS